MFLDVDTDQGAVAVPAEQGRALDLDPVPSTFAAILESRLSLLSCATLAGQRPRVADWPFQRSLPNVRGLAPIDAS
jgi:hypothetical protein